MVRHAFSQLLVLEAHDATDRNGVVSLRIGESGADGELGAVDHLHDQSAQTTFVPTSSRFVADDTRFGIVETFHFLQRAGSAICIR